MSQPDRRPATYADLLAATVPDRPVPELVDGELHYKASPRGTHAHTQGAVRGELHGHTTEGGPGGWWILVEPDVRFAPTTVLRPDLAGWRRERLPVVPETAVDVVPDWVCEVLSPGHVGYDRIVKLSVYAAFGVAHVWLVHPEERVLEAYRLSEGTWSSLGAWGEDAEVRIPPFEEQVLAVGRLFAPRPPPFAAEPPVVAQP